MIGFLMQCAWIHMKWADTMHILLGFTNLNIMGLKFGSKRRKPRALYYI